MPQRQANRPALAGPVLALAAVFLFLVNASQSEAQTYKVIHNFTAKGNDGATPYGGPTLDSSGNLYGTTNLGGKYGSGSIYKLSPDGTSWKYTSLYSLRGGSDGAGPAFGTLAMNNGALFGTTEGGGYFGTAFRVMPHGKGWRENVVHSFGRGTDGAEPVGGVVFDTAGNFYGTTLLGGTGGNGTVFKVAPSGIEHVIYRFKGGTDALNPAAGVTLDAKGNLYGTTSFGGANGIGAIYKLSPAGSGWKETILYNFQGMDDGQNPVGGVI